ncbi:dihydrofolate reductase family protein [Amnibacterium sp. CER49]|uniref:dihydrofolate reductase family protein n=1 Tax=Amnibacterium sp. CER49 TaxID=3039161 RepID=UPI00244C004A|nr:dihydrofolate reductase family protein [Amnibacterium sp. CER49]MDH2443368.1 dihydrofolate reductase family protein [Amnibacterium sp. CER49]
MIERLHPGPVVTDADDEQLLDWYSAPSGADPWVRFEFIASADGAATVQGRAGGLGSAEDQRVLHLLRRLADVLLVGAGTIRAEGYGGELLDAPGRAWRQRRGMRPRPVVAVVSAHLDLDPASAFFADAPEPPLVLTKDGADRDRRRALERVARVIGVGERAAEPGRILAALGADGHRVVHSEGGPTLFGAFQRAGAVDDLCLSLSPTLAGSDEPRIVRDAPLPAPLGLRLAHVLRADDLLLLRYASGRG